MINFLLFISFCYLSSLSGQQHDFDLQAQEIADLLFQRGLEYYHEAWQTYKKSNPESPSKLGNCLEFSLSLIQELKNAEVTYADFEKTRPNRINPTYTATRLELEKKKNLLHFAVLVDSQMRSTILNDACRQSLTVQSPNR